MQADQKPAVKEPPDDQKRQIQAESPSDAQRLDSKTEAELQKVSEDLKARIEEAKRRNDMPIDSKLGNPAWEQSVADGHLDVPDEEDDK